MAASPCERLTAAIQDWPGDGKGRVRIGCAGPSLPNSVAVSGRKPLGALADQAAPDQSERRRADDAEQRRSLDHQSEVDGEFVAAGDEFLGAVQGIDQEEGLGQPGPPPLRRCALFRQRRNIGRQPGKALGDDAVGGKVGFRHRRAVGFAVDAHPRAIDFQDRRSGQSDELGQGRHQAGRGVTVDRRGKTDVRSAGP